MTTWREIWENSEGCGERGLALSNYVCAVSGLIFRDTFYLALYLLGSLTLS